MDSNTDVFVFTDVIGKEVGNNDSVEYDNWQFKSSLKARIMNLSNDRLIFAKGILNSNWIPFLGF